MSDATEFQKSTAELVGRGVDIAAIIPDLIKDHKAERERLIKHYLRYVAHPDATPILTRPAPSSNFPKINNKLNHDYPKILVDTKAGYFMGIPPTIQYVDDDKGEEENTEEEAVLRDYMNRNDFNDVLNETAIRSGNEGYGVWFVYIDSNGEESIQRVEPWETIFIPNRSTQKVEYVLRYYTISIVELTDAGVYDRTEVWRAEWWTKDSVTFYLGPRSGLEGENISGAGFQMGATPSSLERFTLDVTEEPNPKPNVFGEIPFIMVDNNHQHMADWDAVNNLIDSHDTTKSNLANDIQQFAGSFMKFIGIEGDDKTVESMTFSGGLTLPQGTDVDFLTKDLDPKAHEYFLTSNDGDIHKLAGIPDMASKDFSGNVPIISIRMKLFTLEALSVIAENKFRRALKEMWRIVLKSINVRLGDDIDYLNIDWAFNRNIPTNTKEEAEIQQILQGRVSDETRWSLASFIDDPKAEAERVEDEGGEVEQEVTRPGPVLVMEGEDDEEEGAV